MPALRRPGESPEAAAAPDPLRLPRRGPRAGSAPAGSPPPITATTRPRPCCSACCSAAVSKGWPASARSTAGSSGPSWACRARRSGEEVDSGRAPPGATIRRTAIWTVPRNRVRHRLLPCPRGGAIRISRRASPAWPARARRADGRARPRLARAPGRPARRGRRGGRPRRLCWACRRSSSRSPSPGCTAAPGLPIRRAARRGRSSCASSAPGGRRSAVACDCGGGWRWEAAGGLLSLRRASPARRNPSASHILWRFRESWRSRSSASGSRLHHRPVEPWMFQGSPHRAGPRAASRDRETASRCETVAPATACTPWERAGSRRLKEVLIDRRVPRQASGTACPCSAWESGSPGLPGVTIDRALPHRPATRPPGSPRSRRDECERAADLLKSQTARRTSRPCSTPTPCATGSPTSAARSRARSEPRTPCWSGSSTAPSSSWLGPRAGHPGAGPLRADPGATRAGGLAG